MTMVFSGWVHNLPIVESKYFGDLIMPNQHASVGDTIIITREGKFNGYAFKVVERPHEYTEYKGGVWVCYNNEVVKVPDGTYKIKKKESMLSCSNHDDVDQFLKEQTDRNLASVFG